MGASNPRPTCPVTNSCDFDTGTSALTRTSQQSPAGICMSVSGDELWSRIANGCFSAATRDKVRILSANLSLLEQWGAGSTRASFGGRLPEAKALDDPDRMAPYSEHIRNRKETVEAIAAARRAINSLTAEELFLPGEELTSLKAYLNQRIGDLTPYYTQQANINLLEVGSRAWTRTCNVTSLAMALEALGVDQRKFAGNTDKFIRTTVALEPLVVDPQHSRGRACFNPVDLRFPDFLQYAAVYMIFEALPGKDSPEAAFLEDVKKARKKAAGQVTSTSTLKDLAALFGIDGSLGGVSSLGTAERELYGTEEAEAALLKKKKKDQTDDDVRATKHFQSLENAEQKELDKVASLEQNFDLGLKKFKKQVLAAIPQPSLQSQVVVNKAGYYKSSGEFLGHGHFVKLHSIAESGLIFDDPWKEGKLNWVSWADAYKEGYFRGYLILRIGSTK
jgi:hypothetical protein